MVGSIIRGRYTIWAVSDSGLWTPLFSHENTLMTTWGFVACKLFGFGDVDYRISKMYIEYYNVSSPTDTVTVPTYTKNDSRTYYDNLSAPADYLRVPLMSNPAIHVASGYESVFTEGVDGNELTFTGMSTGTVGMHGVPFSASANSKVYGIALVAAPAASDKSRDVIVTRGYYPTTKQQLKQASGQIGITWNLKFES